MVTSENDCNSDSKELKLCIYYFLFCNLEAGKYKCTIRRGGLFAVIFRSKATNLHFNPLDVVLVWVWCDKKCSFIKGVIIKSAPA